MENLRNKNIPSETLVQRAGFGKISCNLIGRWLCTMDLKIAQNAGLIGLAPRIGRIVIFSSVSDAH